MRLYLAGPMRGVPEYNFPAFHEAAANLRERGYKVWSPAERDEADGFNPKTDEAKSADYYMAIDLPQVCKSDAVVALDGWENSQGARIEVHVARELGKTIFDYPNLIPIVARSFDTGATRDQDAHKYDYEGFLSPLVLQRFGAYMHRHRVQVDGSQRDSDNWQKGIPFDAYMKSEWRHHLDWWALHRGLDVTDFTGETVDIEEAICGVIFNAQGYLHELLKTAA